jgi:uncharacterized protein YodC (DUF2158 family)
MGKPYSMDLRERVVAAIEGGESTHQAVARFAIGIATAGVWARLKRSTAPAFRRGALVRLRSGGPLMTVRNIKGDRVDCFWTDVNGQINADSFPVDVLQMF